MENQVKRREIFIPKGHTGEEADLLVAVNGVNYLLPRGAKSKVPEFVAAEVERSVRAQNVLEERMDALMKQ